MLQVAQLIADDLLSARIDSHNKVIYISVVDNFQILKSNDGKQRSKTYDSILGESDEYLITARYVTMRSKLIHSQMIIKSKGDDN